MSSQDEMTVASAASSRKMFSPLPPNHFRLVRIMTADFGFADHLQLQLQSFPLSNAPAYKAISYTWGSAAYELKHEPHSPPEFVEGPAPAPVEDRVALNGGLVSINLNLYNALSCLFRNNVINFDTWLWADELCINQHDTREKSSQVGLLHKFFPVANEVIVWLGQLECEADEIEMAAFINNFETIVEGIGKLYVGDSSHRTHLDISDSEVSGAFGVDSIHEPVANVLKMIRSMRWFHRLWPGQEFATAKRLRMFLGSSEIDVERFLFVIDFLRANTWSVGASIEALGSDFEQLDWLGGMTRMENLLQMLEPRMQVFDHKVWSSFNRKGYFDKYAPLPHNQEDKARARAILLSWTLMHQSTASCLDPRDKVYGNQGLIEHFLSESQNEFNVPDYSITIKALYTATSAQLLQRSQSLDVVAMGYMVDRSRKISGLPSWVANYQNIDDGSFSRLLNGGNGVRNKEVLLPTSQGYLKISGGQLGCEGICLSKAQLVMEPDVAVDSPGRGYSDVFEALDFVRSLDVSRLSRRPAEVVWRTLCFDRDRDRNNESPMEELEASFWLLVVWESISLLFPKTKARSSDEECRSALQRFLEVVSSHKVLSDASTESVFTAARVCAKYRGWDLDQARPIDPDLALLDTVNQYFNSANRYAAFAPRIAGDLRVFTTSNNALAMAGQCTKSGDELWVLKNATHPWILRPTNNPDHYIYVSPCFLLPGQFDLPTPEEAERLLRKITLV